MRKHTHTRIQLPWQYHNPPNNAGWQPMGPPSNSCVFANASWRDEPRWAHTHRPLSATYPARSHKWVFGVTPNNVIWQAKAGSKDKCCKGGPISPSCCLFAPGVRQFMRLLALTHLGVRIFELTHKKTDGARWKWHRVKFVSTTNARATDVFAE